MDNFHLFLSENHASTGDSCWLLSVSNKNDACIVKTADNRYLAVPIKHAISDVRNDILKMRNASKLIIWKGWGTVTKDDMYASDYFSNAGKYVVDVTSEILPSSYRRAYEMYRSAVSVACVPTPPISADV